MGDHKTTGRRRPPTTHDDHSLWVPSLARTARIAVVTPTNRENLWSPPKKYKIHHILPLFGSEINRLLGT
ncbi:hypothetical protein [Corynebacterium parakroppenstedtii]|uniref:hypothetical protein n=1 Tax=Corynebacterium parakroppenstedtii TaxID=2828363 RepID=UPI000A43FAA2|nr:hypothetical protein [Corynebacterium parakroppenstedtii]MBY0795625.1 hypothetical protein [Corynebacterium parakroppenstedtii]MCF6813538.1 hypothetical protein [Corynebacterium parakroppenstedtii]MCF7182838.1 hypothetical protein [Corynebacterium parakroppenstedtii]MCF8700752.1 hypothetical protein [Corynebacterium parakroppenstedtii]